jgi:hypothetical protein
VSKIAAIVLALALLVDIEYPRLFVWQWEPGHGGGPAVVIENGEVVLRRGDLLAVFFATTAARACYRISATYPDGTAQEVVNHTECGAALPLVHGP